MKALRYIRGINLVLGGYNKAVLGIHDYTSIALLECFDNLLVIYLYSKLVNLASIMECNNITVLVSCDQEFVAKNCYP